MYKPRSITMVSSCLLLFACFSVAGISMVEIKRAAPKSEISVGEALVENEIYLPVITNSFQKYNIPFVYADDFMSGLTIHAVWAQKAESNLIFHFDYTSDADRGLSFFDPPGGDTISIQKNVPQGSHTISFEVSVADLQNVSNITVNFYIPAIELTGAIFLDFEEIEKLLQ